jgi:glycosyltransferase involved in cell wall biosynthesis
MLAVIETHPVQYHAPVYRAVQEHFGIPVTAIYGSDFSVAGYRDAEFGATFAWDTDLLSGYASVFLSRSAPGTTPDLRTLSASGLRDALRAVNPRATMVVGYSPSFHRVAWREARALGRPVLFRGETTDVAVDRSWAAAAMRDAALRLAYRRCAACLYIGRHSRDHFMRHGVTRDRLFFSPYCVDESTFSTGEETREDLRARGRDALGVPDTAIVLLYSGKLSLRKGLDLLIPAVSQLPAATRADVIVALLGDGELRARMVEDAARAGVVVRPLGFRNQRELSRFYHAADLLVLPSRASETWGLVTNEALLHGLPAVVSDRVGCAPDLVTDGMTGAVFAAGSAEGLSSALQRAWPLMGRRDVRDACRERAAGYSVLRAAEGIAHAYRRVAAPAPALS